NIVALATWAHFHGGRIELRIVLQYDFCENLSQFRMLNAHDFDGKVTGIFNQRLLWRDVFHHNRDNSSSYSDLSFLYMGPGWPFPTGAPSSSSTGSTSLVAEVTRISSAAKTSARVILRASNGTSACSARVASRP